MRHTRRYLWIVFSGAVIGALFAASHALFIGKDALIRCDPRGIDATYYMAYCHARTFTEYDLGAHYFGLEPTAIASLKGAQVLFLGNSRTGHTFSSAATETAFASRGVPYYVMGFGYEASSTVALALIKKHGLTPKVLIINADPFFTNDFRKFREPLMSERPGVYLTYVFKKYFQRAQAWLCDGLISACGDALTIYRSTVNGAWDTRTLFKKRVAQKDPVAIVEDDNHRASEIAEAIEIARVFAQGMHASDKCVIVTTIPSPYSTRALAKAAASEIDAHYIEPRVDGLRTFDDSHLMPEDDERWSAAFLELASPVIDDCLG